MRVDVNDAAIEAVGQKLGIQIRGGRGFVVSTDRPIAAVVFHEWRHPTVECSMYAESPRWATRGVIGFLLEHPFNTLKCSTLLTLIPRRNKRARRFNEGIGFRLVGVIQDGADAGDVCLYQMTRKDAERWLRP